MHLIIAGCEYSGKTTLATELSKWMIRTIGLDFVRWHDHFVVPNLDMHLVVSGPDSANPADCGIGKNIEDLHTKEDKEQILGLSPSLLEQFQRQMIWQHLHHDQYTSDRDMLMIDAWYAEAVYGPLYYGYGSPGSFADRKQRAREWDRHLLDVAPDAVLVLIHASPDVILQRMETDRHPMGILKQKDIEKILGGFREEYNASLIGKKFSLDTSHNSIEQTFDEFMLNITPYL